MRMITLLTDFGLNDGYTGIMKGVILGIAPEVQIIDLTHLIPPQNILAGTLALGRAFPYFPSGTIHVAVVDPGVGTQRRPLAAQLGTQFFVGPDNGLLTPLLDQAQATQGQVEIVQLDQPDFWLPVVSQTFHGRDVFAPVAAHLAQGIPLSSMGSPVSDPVRLTIPVPEKTAFGWRGQVLHVDAFGNLATNLERRLLDGLPNPHIRMRDLELRSLARTFGEGRPGQPLAVLDSSGFLSICIVNGSAASAFGVTAGEPVEIINT